MQEALALREELAALAAMPEWGLLERYDLLRRWPPKALPDRLFRKVPRSLGSLGLMHPHVTNYQWLPTLKHGRAETGARTLLVWGIGWKRDELRQACRGISDHLAENSRLTPVLVTDVSDFSFFSRLGWLVEFLPELTGTGASYRERKRHYLAWRYRDALVVPVSAGLVSESEWKIVLGL